MGNITSIDDNTDALRQAVQQMLSQHNFTHFVTLAFNRDTDINGARKTLGAWHGRLDSKLLGHRWAGRPEAERTFFIAFPEHISTNLHYHLMVRPAAGRKCQFDDVAGVIWTGLVASGSINIQPITNRKKLNSYVTKELNCASSFENFVISTEFSKK